MKSKEKTWLCEWVCRVGKRKSEFAVICCVTLHYLGWYKESDGWEIMNQHTQKEGLPLNFINCCLAHIYLIGNLQKRMCLISLRTALSLQQFNLSFEKQLIGLYALPQYHSKILWKREDYAQGHKTNISIICTFHYSLSWRMLMLLKYLETTHICMDICMYTVSWRIHIVNALCVCPNRNRLR